mmetsp:Transcript_18323/g.58007  ORF Transcript_18323/g.58007 Transcript_18323/m.58007 type:complete len:284 (-) Transcript_18323:279-1130(-)
MRGVHELRGHRKHFMCGRLVPPRKHCSQDSRRASRLVAATACRTCCLARRPCVPPRGEGPRGDEACEAVLAARQQLHIGRGSRGCTCRADETADDGRFGYERRGTLMEGDDTTEVEERERCVQKVVSGRALCVTCAIPRAAHRCHAFAGAALRRAPTAARSPGLHRRKLNIRQTGERSFDPLPHRSHGAMQLRARGQPGEQRGCEFAGLAQLPWVPRSREEEPAELGHGSQPHVCVGGCSRARSTGQLSRRGPTAVERVEASIATDHTGAGMTPGVLGEEVQH